FFFASRRRHTRSTRDWSSDVCSSDLLVEHAPGLREADIALTEIAEKKLTFESTFGQNGATEAPARVVLFPGVTSSKKAMAKKKEIGRASCREREWMRGEVGGGSSKEM